MRLNRGHMIRKWPHWGCKPGLCDPPARCCTLPQEGSVPLPDRRVAEATAQSRGNHISLGFLSEPKERGRGADPSHSGGRERVGRLKAGPRLQPAGANCSEASAPALDEARSARQAAPLAHPKKSLKLLLLIFSLNF